MNAGQDSQNTEQVDDEALRQFAEKLLRTSPSLRVQFHDSILDVEIPRMNGSKVRALLDVYPDIEVQDLLKIFLCGLEFRLKKTDPGSWSSWFRIVVHRFFAYLNHWAVLIYKNELLLDKIESFIIDRRYHDECCEAFTKYKSALTGQVNLDQA